MSDTDNTTIEVSIMGRSYPVRCPEREAQELQQSARYLEKQMRKLSQHASMKSTDRIAIITALNLAHELLKEQARNDHAQLEQNIRRIRSKVRHALAEANELEVSS